MLVSKEIENARQELFMIVHDDEKTVKLQLKTACLQINLLNNVQTLFGELCPARPECKTFFSYGFQNPESFSHGLNHYFMEIERICLMPIVY